jgi:fatty-acyl-CoA synthase/long-chain acyl-CoA synthetase
VCIVASLQEGLNCTSEELIDFCKQRTSKYMVPKVVYFLDKFPLTPIGKIDKKELRKMFAQGILTI